MENTVCAKKSASWQYFIYLLNEIDRVTLWHDRVNSAVVTLAKLPLTSMTVL